MIKADEIKGQLRAYVEQITEPDRKQGATRGQWKKYVCPLCGSGSRGGSNSDGAFSIKANGTSWKCFSCGKSGDIFDLIREYEHITSYADQVKRAASVLNIDIAASNERKPDRKEQKQEEDLAKRKAAARQLIDAAAQQIDDPEIRSYLVDRGISSETAHQFRLGFKKDLWLGTDQKGNAVTAPFLIIPTGKDGCNYNARNISPDAADRDRFRKPGQIDSEIFNVTALDQERPIYVTEGEIDALSLIQAGAVAVGLGGISGTRKLLSEIDRRIAGNTWTGSTFLLAMDNDDAGKKANEELMRELTNRSITAKICTEDLYKGYKDANEAWMQDTEPFIDRVKEIELSVEDEKERRKREYRADNSVSGYIDLFRTKIQQVRNVIPTGFPFLDEILDGGLYPGLYVLGASSSLGKTTLMLQIADQIASQGQDVLYFSMEMSREELIAKSISRIIASEAYDPRSTTGWKKKYVKTQRDIQQGSRYSSYTDKDIQVIDEAFETYRGYSDHIFIVHGEGNIGVDKIKEDVKRHIEMTGSVPVVCLDYLQLLALYDPRATDKQNTDRSVLELRRLVRECNLTVFTISSLNREAYKKNGSNNGLVTKASFKESGMIEYGADCLMGLEFQSAASKNDEYDEEELLQKDIRKVRLKVLKNRSGVPSVSTNFDFHAPYNYFMNLKMDLAR